MVGCSAPRIAGHDYLTTVTLRGETEKFWLQSTEQVDSLLRIYEIDVKSETLIGEIKPFFEIKNSEIFIYTEKKN